MAGGGLMQLVAYGAQDIYLGPRYEKFFRVRPANKFMYHGYLTPDFDATFNGEKTNPVYNTINRNQSKGL
jgi:hypothetical protein